MTDLAIRIIWLAVLIGVLSTGAAPARAQSPADSSAEKPTRLLPPLPSVPSYTLELTAQHGERAYGLAFGFPSVNVPSVSGLAVGLVGVDAHRSIHGVAIGGFGIGTEENLYGLSISGFGIGADRHIAGLTIAGFGVGAADISGITLAGFGIGADDRLRGLSVSLVGAGAYAFEGFTGAGLAAGATEATGLFAAPAYFHIEDGGHLTGVSISGFNRIEGQQYGITIGLFNYAAELHGLQVGLLNYARNNSSPFKLLPFLNVHW